MTDLEKNVRTLIEKAANANAAEEAVMYSQAALNVANAISSLFVVFPLGTVDKDPPAGA